MLLLLSTRTVVVPLLVPPVRPEIEGDNVTSVVEAINDVSSVIDCVTKNTSDAVRPIDGSNAKNDMTPSAKIRKLAIKALRAELNKCVEFILNNSTLIKNKMFATNYYSSHYTVSFYFVTIVIVLYVHKFY